MGSVAPAGAAPFTASFAIWPPAPVRFSTIPAGPGVVRMWSASNRVSRSLDAPAGKPSTMRIVPSCPAPGCETLSENAKSAARHMRRMVASAREKESAMKLLVLLLLACSFSAAAQDWPRQKALHIVVGFAPGSTTDLVARLVAPKLSEAIGQSVIVENKPGAGGNVATQQVKRMAPDGYTLLVTSVAFAVNPSLYPNAGYDPFSDFIPVILGPSTPNIITVNPSVPAKNLQELIALARKDRLSYASSGIGTTTHLSMERIKMAAKVDITHVPYQPAQAVGAAVAGHTQISSTSMPPAVPQVKAGKVRAIAVTSAQRSPALPEVPTVNEQGLSGFDDLTWTAFFAPAGMPHDLVNRLNSEINRALSAPEVRERLAQLGLEWRANTSGEFATFLRDEVRKWAKAVKESGAKAD